MRLGRSLAIAKHDLRILVSDPLFVIIGTAMPLVLMAFLKPAFRATLVVGGVSGANGAEQAVPGITVMFAFFLVATVAVSFFREHGWGTWERLRASFATSPEILAGKLMLPVALGTAQLMALFFIGAVVFDLRVRGAVIGLPIILLALEICVACVGLLLAAICRTVNQMNALANLGALLLAGLGGTLAPVTALPAWARTIAPATPTYWAMRGFRRIIIDGAGVGAALTSALVLVAFGGVCCLFSARRFAFDDQKEWA